MKCLRNKFPMMFIIIGFVAVFSGCVARKVPENINNSGNQGSYSPELGTPTTEADNIAQAVKRIPGIKNAIAVINGDIAYIGVNLDTNSGLDNTSKIESIKEEVADTARNADPDINVVYVSADADFIEKISRISNDVRNGKAVESFKEELDEIVKRVTHEKY